MFFDFQIISFLKEFYNFKLLNFLTIFLASYLPYFLVLFFLFFLFFKNNFKKRIEILFFTFLLLFLNWGVFKKIINLIYNRPRPFQVLNFEPLIQVNENFSLPSGHAVLFFSLALSLYYFNKKLGIYFLILSFFITLARVYAGVHWLTDIILGLLIALLGFFIVKIIFEKYKKKSF